MVHPQVVDGEDGFHIWTPVMNMLNKQSQTANKSGPSIWWFDEGAKKTLTINNWHVTKCYTGLQDLWLL
jgi:hypothetical protein